MGGEYEAVADTLQSRREDVDPDGLALRSWKNQWYLWDRGEYRALPDAEKAQHDLRAVGKLLVSSAPARQETKRAILQLFPNGRLFELYGSTEAGWVTVLRPDEQISHLGSVGREWAGSGPIKLIGDDGQEVPDGEVGELFSHTPWVFAGYWRNPEKTAEAFHGPWCSVGDVARRASLRRVLDAIVRASVGGAASVSVGDLVRAGWPGEKMRPDSGAGRVYVALSTLRRFGLSDAIERYDEGYRLRPDVRVERV